MRLTPFRLSGIALLVAAVFSVPAAIAFLFSVDSRAAGWVERRYDPPVGSRWIIEITDTAEDNTPGGLFTSVKTTRSELTIESKIADGFHIIYAVRDATFQGIARSMTLLSPINKALSDLTIRATISTNGVPLHVDNLDEISVTAHAAIDRMVTALANNTEMADTERHLATSMLIPSDKRAPKIYSPILYALAVGQNTGLHPGESRSNTEAVDLDNPLDPDNPLKWEGSFYKTRNTLNIDSADPATGDVHYVRVRLFDPDSWRDVLDEIKKEATAANMTPQQLEDYGKEYLKQFDVALESRSKIDVMQGMTRAIHEDVTTTITAFGRTSVNKIHRVVAVVPAH